MTEEDIRILELRALSIWLSKPLSNNFDQELDGYKFTIYVKMTFSGKEYDAMMIRNLAQ